MRLKISIAQFGLIVIVSSIAFSMVASVSSSSEEDRTADWWHRNTFVVAKINGVKLTNDAVKPDILDVDLLAVVNTDQMISTKLELEYYREINSNNGKVGPLSAGQTIFACLNNADGHWRVSMQEMHYFNGTASVLAVKGADDPAVKDIVIKLDKIKELGREKAR